MRVSLDNVYVVATCVTQYSAVSLEESCLLILLVNVTLCFCRKLLHKERMKNVLVNSNVHKRFTML